MKTIIVIFPDGSVRPMSFSEYTALSGESVAGTLVRLVRAPLDALRLARRVGEA